MAVPKIAPIAAGPAPPRKARARGFCADRIEMPRACEHEDERRREGDQCRQQTPAHSGGGIADHSDRLHDGTRSDLPERDCIEELPVGHPVVVVHRVRLHQRDDDEPAAVGQRADLECDPAKRQQAARRGRAGRQDRQRRDAAPAIGRLSSSARGVRSGRCPAGREPARGRAWPPRRLPRSGRRRTGANSPADASCPGAMNWRRVRPPPRSQRPRRRPHRAPTAAAPTRETAPREQGWRSVREG